MTATTSPGWVGLRLEPLDVLFFRDGRPFDAATRVESGLPTPQTLAGAIRTALLARTGFRFDEFARRRKAADLKTALEGAAEWVTKARFRGPWLALSQGPQAVEPLLPLPAVLARANASSDWSCAMPRRKEDVPGWDDPELLPLWRREEPDPKAEGGWLALSGLKEFLRGRFVQHSRGLTDAFFTKADLYSIDNRIGIGIDKHTLTSAEGELYGIRFLTLKREVAKRPGATLCLYAEIQPGPAAPTRPWLDGAAVPFGGEGRHVRVTEVASCVWPRTDATLKRSLWYLATPTFLPPSMKSQRALPTVAGLMAAASGPGMAVSGWDVARNGPRPTRFAVPAGAAYFLDGPGGEDSFLGDLRDQKADELRAEGWGFALQGRWPED